MDDTREFAQQAARRISGAQKSLRESFGERFDLALTEPVVEELIKAAFYASMIPDEGRYSSVCLMSYRRDCGRAFHRRIIDNDAPPIHQLHQKRHKRLAPRKFLQGLGEKFLPHVV